MKFRVLDLLQCSCGKKNLKLTSTDSRKVDYNEVFESMPCKHICAFNKCFIDERNVSPQDCRECFTQEIMSGDIICECGKKYQIIKGIPRFLPEDLALNFKKIQKTFSYEWKMFHFGDRNWGQDISYRKNLFLQGMGVTKNDLKGKLIFDAGCGSGLLSMEMAESFGMEVVAMDLSFGIEQAYAHNTNPFVHFIQGSVLEPPLQNQIFDYVYCAGVLVALPDTRTGFKSIITKLKKTGRCFIWVYHPIDNIYHPNDKIKLTVYNWIRTYITSRLPISVQYYIYLSLMPLFLLKQKNELLAGKKKDELKWREKMQALFDMFSPIYQNRHTHEEVIEWFKGEGFNNINISDKGPWGFGTYGDK